VKGNVGKGWLAAATLAGFTLVAFAARAQPRQAGEPTVVRSGPPQQAPATALPQDDRLGAVPPKAASDDFRVPWSLIQWVLVATLLLAVLGLAVALWPRFLAWLQARRQARRTVRPPSEPAPDEVRRRVSNTLRSTMSQMANGQIRDGVILCWHRLEQTAEATGLRRQPSDTSSDLAERLLSSLPLSEAPLNRLAALYREARFSSHPIPDEAVAQARADLAQLRSELEAAGPVGPVEPRARAAGQSRA
jgi:hypothetical protein